jgi:hypothetical protein
MPSSAQLTEPQLVSFLECSDGTVESLYATSDPSALDWGIGGGVQVGGQWFWCPTSFTTPMLTVAAFAKQAGTKVKVRYWSNNRMIDDIASPNFPKE